MLTAALVLSLVACNALIPEQLEAAAVTPDGSAVEDTWAAVDVTGTLSVSGADQDWTLAVPDQAGSVVVKLHSPGHSDLTEMDGTQTRVEVSESGLHGERGMLLSDEEGPVYFLDHGGWSWRAEELFGAGFVTWGDVMAEDRDDQYNWDYTTAVFQTDNGPVALLPGDVDSLRIDGDLWRVVVIAAYRVDPHPRAALPCGGISDMLSYEMVRVDTAPEPIFLSRPAGLQLAYMGCL